MQAGLPIERRPLGRALGRPNGFPYENGLAGLLCTGWPARGGCTWEQALSRPELAHFPNQTEQLGRPGALGSDLRPDQAHFPGPACLLEAPTPPRPSEPCEHPGRPVGGGRPTTCRFCIMPLGEQSIITGGTMNFPDRTDAIQIHRTEARKARQAGDYPSARSSYMRWVESLRQQSLSDGALKQELEAAKQEYSEFAKTDPAYLTVCETVLPRIEAEPGILQKDLYKIFPQLAREDISYALYFAAEHGRLTRAKKGNSYALSLPV